MNTTTKTRLLGCALAGLVIAAVARCGGMDMINAAMLGAAFAGACTMISTPDAKRA